MSGRKLVLREHNMGCDDMDLCRLTLAERIFPGTLLILKTISL